MLLELESEETSIRCLDRQNPFDWVHEVQTRMHLNGYF